MYGYGTTVTAEMREAGATVMKRKRDNSEGHRRQECSQGEGVPDTGRKEGREDGVDVANMQEEAGSAWFYDEEEEDQYHPFDEVDEAYPDWEGTEF